MDKKDCPQFGYDGESIEAILAWGHVDVVWSDVFINGEGESHKHPEWACWSLGWESGSIAFTSLRTETVYDELRARCAAALFVYLWCSGIPTHIADKCAESYIHLFKID